MAFYWYKAASDLGDAEATYHVGRMYWLGEGVEQDKEEGLKYLRQSDEMGCEKAESLLEKISSSQEPEEEDTEEESPLFERLKSKNPPSRDETTDEEPARKKARTL